MLMILIARTKKTLPNRHNFIFSVFTSKKENQLNRNIDKAALTNKGRKFGTIKSLSFELKVNFLKSNGLYLSVYSTISTKQVLLIG